MILTSSRTRPDGPVDPLSDYDLILAVSEVGPFAFDDAWIAAYDRPMVRWGDQGEMHALATYFRGVVYQNYVKIDYSIWPVELLSRIETSALLPDQLDVGYRVLLDKDQRAAGWKPPSYQAHIPARPTETQYQALVEEFWWGTTYVAKSLWRDELVFARWVLDQDLKLETLRRILEWRIEIDHHRSVKLGVYGRGLKHLLPPPIWSELARVCLAGRRGDLGGARARDRALPPGRAGCGQRARLSLSVPGGCSGERLSGSDSRAAVVSRSRRQHLNHLKWFPKEK
jgi:aminoglycoside 6-adenylyltransferase